MTDVLFCSYNRLAMTQASLRRLHNSLLGEDASLLCFDDGSTDGTHEWVRDFCGEHRIRFRCRTERERMASPVAIMSWFLGQPGTPVFAKIDNDVIVPDGWLRQAAGIMSAHPELDLLGIEPPASRTAAPWSDGTVPHAPELQAGVGEQDGYARCGSIGGIGLVRRECFLNRKPMRPSRTYGGFYHWQLQHAEVIKGWIVPPLKLFLLDRLPLEPWTTLSTLYISRGWQRPWTAYSPAAAELWSWWLPKINGV